MKLAKFSDVDPSPILSFNINGIPEFLNTATYKLLERLQLDSVDDILPNNHAGLTKACLKTHTPLTDKRAIKGRTIVWTYHPDDDVDLVYIFGHDITDYRSDGSSVEGLPNLNPDPVLSIGADGEPEYTNPAALQLMQEMKQDDVINILPDNHDQLVETCLDTGQTLTGERQFPDRKINWTYRPVDYSDLIYVYGHDFSQFIPPIK